MEWQAVLSRFFRGEAHASGEPGLLDGANSGPRFQNSAGCRLNGRHPASRDPT